jgi:hypothetical protein
MAILPKTTSADIVQKYVDAVRSSEERVDKYEKEKNEIQKQAQALEALRDDASRHGKPFGFAVIFFQVAILLSSVAGLFKRRVVWYLALPIGAIGVVYFVNGFLLFMK